jgi:hypothetical protein
VACPQWLKKRNRTCPGVTQRAKTDLSGVARRAKTERACAQPAIARNFGLSGGKADIAVAHAVVRNWTRSGPSSSVSHLIFWAGQMCSLGMKAFQSSKRERRRLKAFRSCTTSRFEGATDLPAELRRRAQYSINETGAGRFFQCLRQRPILRAIGAANRGDTA